MISTNGKTMPNIYGTSFHQAVKLINELNLTLNSLSYEENSYKPNIILNQSIYPGEEIQNGDKIDLVVSGINPIRYLPSIFKKYDRKQDGFLSRYLWIFQHIFYSITAKLDNLDNFFNPINTSNDFFKWLASWFAVNLDFDVPDVKLRFVVKEAVNLYKWRGTALGLTKYLEIVTGIKPEIREKDIPGNEYIIMENKLVENPIYEKDSNSYCFVVSFPVEIDYFSVDTVKKIHQIIKSEKPAHTNYYVTFEQKLIETEHIGHAVVGVDEIR